MASAHLRLPHGLNLIQNSVEQGTETTPQAKKRRAHKLAQASRKLGNTPTVTPRTPELLTEGQVRLSTGRFVTLIR